MTRGRGHVGFVRASSDLDVLVPGRCYDSGEEEADAPASQPVTLKNETGRNTHTGMEMHAGPGIGTFSGHSDNT